MASLKPKMQMKPLFRTTTTVSALTLLCLLLAGCEAPGPNKPSRFRGSARASVVLQYNSWDYIFMIRPALREGAYLRQIRGAELAGVLDQAKVPRETAVISFGWDYDPKQLRELLADWKRLLKACGFRRVVFVRGTSGASVENAVIIEETELS
jgi:hypothetical protein